MHWNSKASHRAAATRHRTSTIGSIFDKFKNCKLEKAKANGILVKNIIGLLRAERAALTVFVSEKYGLLCFCKEFSNLRTVSKQIFTPSFAWMDALIWLAKRFFGAFVLRAISFWYTRAGRHMTLDGIMSVGHWTKSASILSSKGIFKTYSGPWCNESAVLFFPDLSVCIF